MTTLVLSNDRTELTIENEEIILEIREERIVLELGTIGLQGATGATGTGGATPIDSEADDTILIGQPIYVKGNGHIGLADSNSMPQCLVAGVALNDTAIGFSCPWVLSTVITRSDWTAIVGTTNLTTGALYFLSLTGTMTNISSTITGYSVLLGKAVTPLKFLFLPLYPIRL